MESKLLSEYLSLDDVKRLGVPFDSGFFCDSQVLINVIPKNYQRKALIAELIEEIKTRLYETLPICRSILDALHSTTITLLLTNQEDGSFEFTYNYKEILCWFFSYYIARYPMLFSDYTVALDRKFQGLAIEDPEFPMIVKDIFTDIFKKISDIFTYPTTPYTSKLRGYQDRDEMMNDRRIIRNLMSHIDELLEVIMQPIQVDVSVDLNKDRLLLALSQKALFDLTNRAKNGNESTVESKKKTISALEKRQITFIERYLTITEYFAQKENVSYSTCFVGENGEIFSYEQLKNLYAEYCELYPESVSSCRENLDMSSIFRQYLSDARKKINKEEFVKTISLGFELFPKGIGEERQSGKKKSKMDEVLQNLLNEKHEALLKEKIDFYSSTDYLWTLEEANTFNGYRGYIYANGKVVFDKFYFVSRGELIPAFNEAIITMDLVDFIEMAPQNKTELLERIRNHNGKSVRRFYHTPGWQNRVSTVINQDCLDYDFDLIENLLDEISITQKGDKVYGKKDS